MLEDGNKPTNVFKGNFGNKATQYDPFKPPAEVVALTSKDKKVQIKQIRETIQLKGYLQQYLRERLYPDFRSVPSGVIDSKRDQWKNYSKDQLLNAAKEATVSDLETDPILYLILADLLERSN